jgi:SAM-dependent methyltransferase
LRNGAASYTAYDRFQGDVFSARAMALYCELDCPAPTTARIRGAIEDAAGGERVDIVVSFNVMEHLRDPHVALRRMAAILKPGGILVHRIDYSAHDIWRAYEDDRFLRFPEWLWSLMGSNRGYPNRVRHGDIMATIRSLGLDFDERVTGRLRSGDAAAAEIACGAKLGRPFHAVAS